MTSVKNTRYSPILFVFPLEAFFSALAAFFSFGVIAGCFLTSLLLFCALPMMCTPGFVLVVI